MKGLSQARCELGLFLGSSFGGHPLVWVRSELRVLDTSSKDWSELAPLPSKCVYCSPSGEPEGLEQAAGWAGVHAGKVLEAKQKPGSFQPAAWCVCWLGSRLASFSLSDSLCISGGQCWIRGWSRQLVRAQALFCLQP